MNDILTEREACAKIADNFQDSTWTATSHNYDRIVDYRDACKDISAAIRASPAPKPVITDERIEKVAKAIYDLRYGEGAFEQEKSWRVSDGIEWRTSEPLFAEARAALVAALGGK